MPVSDSYPVQWFDMEKRIVPGVKAVIVGKSYSGKSVLLSNIMKSMSRFTSFGLALTPTLSSKESFSKVMPRAFIDDESIARVESFNKFVIGLYERACSEGKAPKQSYLFCDDTAFNDRFMRSKALSNIFLNGRQFGTSCTIIAQYIKKMPPDMRSNADFIFVFWEINRTIRKIIYEYWFSMMTRDEFESVFSACTRDFGVLVLDVRASIRARDWHDCVFWFKAKLPEELGEYKMCEDDFYRMGDYCFPSGGARADPDDPVWRMGPDGNIYDAESLAGSEVDNLPAIPMA